MPYLIKILLSWYASIFLTIEILSIFNFLSRPYFLASQIILLSVFLKFLKLDLRKFGKSISLNSKTSAIIFILSALTFIQGFFSAPSTTDSMVYHLPRIMYWIQEQTVYQEVIRNEHDFMPPFAEYILLSLYFIAGNDKLLFFSQWLSYVVLIYLSGVVFLQLGGDKKYQMSVRLLIATLPIAALQAASTQTDLVTANLVLVSLSLSLILTKKINLTNFFWLGVSIGLGIQTKPTFFVYLLIPLGVVGFILFKNPKKVFFLFISALIALIFQIRYFFQNITLYGSVLGKHLENGTEVIYVNQIINPSVIFLNIIRNIFLQIPFPFMVIPMQNFLKNLGVILGIDIYDSRITWGDPLLAIKSVIYPQEDIVSNPLHILLILIMIIALFNVNIRKNIKLQSEIVIFSLMLSFVIFCAVFIWQPYHSRLHLPFLIVGTILAVLSILKIKRGTQIVNGAIIFSTALVFLLIIFNVSRSYVSYSLFYGHLKSFSLPLSSIPESFFLKPRVQQYFNARFYWYKPYNNIANRLSLMPEGRTMSFQLMDGFEYPLWVLFKDKGIDDKVLAKNSNVKPQYLIKSSKFEEQVDDYELIQCEKTSVDYGYICLYNHRN